MPDLTPRDDIKKKVSEILKRVDQLLKAGELDQAVTQIKSAKETDPKNVYILAYEERMNTMLEERQKTREIEEKRKAEEEQRLKEEAAKRKVDEERVKAEEEVRRKVDDERRRSEERKKAEEGERRKKEEEENRKKTDLLRKRPEESQGPLNKEEVRGDISRKPVPQISRDILEDTKRKILDDRKKKGLARIEIDQSKSFSHAYEEGLDIYRRVIVEAWVDGATTPEEEEQLSSLRASLMILPEDHERLEREAKLEAYMAGFRRAWASGAISPESASSLAELRKKFKISMEDHEQIETKLLWELRSSSQRAQLVIVDDDGKLLKIVSETLQEAGYQTMAFSTSDEAYRYLKESTPDMIISDINLETSTMGGFTFYEKVREIEHLHEIPFIFLSGLTDEVLVRTGKELGVDDYLTKPFSDDTLLATIKGKLKRYRQLRKSRTKK